MTQEEIREIVRLTVAELSEKKMLKTMDYQCVLKMVEPKLYRYFARKDCEGYSISYALREMKDDPYIDVIYLQYKDRVSLENIASTMDKDVSTIKRNKKRLIYRIYEMCQAGKGG